MLKEIDRNDMEVKKIRDRVREKKFLVRGGCGEMETEVEGEYKECSGRILGVKVLGIVYWLMNFNTTCRFLVRIKEIRVEFEKVDRYYDKYIEDLTNVDMFKGNDKEILGDRLIKLFQALDDPIDYKVIENSSELFEEFIKSTQKSSTESQAEFISPISPVHIIESEGNPNIPAKPTDYLIPSFESNITSTALAELKTKLKKPSCKILYKTVDDHGGVQTSDFPSLEPDLPSPPPSPQPSPSLFSFLSLQKLPNPKHATVILEAEGEAD